MSLLLLIEGVDGVGKTTVAHELCTIFPDAVYLHSGAPDPPDRDPFEDYERRLYEYLDTGKVIICDRWHWGELAYAPVFERQSRFGVAGWRHIELFLQRHGAVVLYMHHDYEVLRTRLERRGDDLIRPGMLPMIQHEYGRLLHETILPVVSLRDPTPDDLDVVVDTLYSYASTWLPTTHSTYVGSRTPEYLLFGERRGTGEPPLDRSAFVPRRSTSGFYLLRHLPEVLWGRLGLCNALEEDPLEVWRSADCPQVVALGAEARAALKRAGVPHGVVPHPQFVRRFHHRSLPLYGRLIERTFDDQEDRSSWRGENLDVLRAGPILEEGTPLPVEDPT